MKKLLSVIVSVVLLATTLLCFDINAFAADTAWSFNNGVLTISANGNDTRMSNYGAGSAPWYSQYHDSITSVKIESRVENIGAYAFYGCQNLKTVDFGSVDTIGNNAFEKCLSLQEAILPDGCTWLYNDVFNGCTSLKYAYINATSTYEGRVPVGMFNYCPALEVLELGSSIVGLSDYALQNCSSLKALIVKGDSLSIGYNAIYNLGKATVFTNSNNVKSVANSNGFETQEMTSFSWSLKDRAFHIKATVVPNYDDGTQPWAKLAEYVDTVRFDVNTTSIGSNAFSNFSNSTYWLDIPESVTNIGDRAFYNSNFNYVKILSNSITIGEDAFGNGRTGFYARFFGPASKKTGAYDWVLQNRKKNYYDWHYYCLNDGHSYIDETIAPTCTEDGYDIYHCPYCDADSQKSNFVTRLGHNYFNARDDKKGYLFNCTKCGETKLTLTAVDVLGYFRNSINSKSNSIDFTTADINHDGIVNAKDYAILLRKIRNMDLTDRETVLDLASTHQEIEGFGASACWWSQTVGNWDTADEIMELLYDDEDGIGLDIYRYNLGAGSRDINDTTMYIDDERTNCFLQEDGTYDWNNDEGAMNALSLAQGYNNDLKVTLFANSPPVYMTENGKAYCNPNERAQNITSRNYGAYAKYFIDCAEHFIEEGYNVTEISPINEPEWDWSGWTNGAGSVSCGQEGCTWHASEAADFYNNYMIPALLNSSICNNANRKVDLSVWECAQMEHPSHWSWYYNYLFSSNEQYANGNANIRSYVDALDTHSYWVDNDARKQTKDDTDAVGKKIRSSEYCQMFNDYNTGVIAHINAEGGSTNGMTIDYGLAMADIIYQDMTTMDAVEWDWWVACARGVYTDALIYVKDDDQSYETAKRLWCLGNYSKFIQVGAQRIDVSTGSAFAQNLYTAPENIYTWKDQYGNIVTDKNNYLEESAYLTPDGSVVIVYINNSDTIEVTTFDKSFGGFTSYVTDTNRDLQKYQSGKANSAVCIPARSVTTVVLK